MDQNDTLEQAIILMTAAITDKSYIHCFHLYICHYIQPFTHTIRLIQLGGSSRKGIIGKQYNL